MQELDASPAETQPATLANQRESPANVSHEPQLWKSISTVLKLIAVTVPLLAVCACSIMLNLLYSGRHIMFVPI